MIKIQDESLNPFFITQDQYCYTICEEVIPKEGTPYIKQYFHYTSLGPLFKNLIKLKLIKEQETYTLQEYISQYEKIQKQILKIKI